MALAAAVIWLAAGTPAQAATPGQNGKVVFTSGRDQNYEVYAMSPDGSNAVNLTSNPAADMYPAVSPDGGRIAFTSFRDGGDGEIYVMDADGTNVANLTQSAGVDTRPAWSPDGQRIAFRSERDGDWEIYVMDADGTNVANLTQSAGVDDAPAWSPAGDRIAFESDRDGNSEIYVMNADGSAQANVTAHLGQDGDPTWSPDGQRIAFASDRDGNYEIYTMTQGGALQTRLTDDAAADSEPAWSPDAAKILFRSTRDANAEIYVMSSGGTAQTRLTSEAGFDGHPDWQPLVTGFARPKGANPIRLSLVPAYEECTAPNGEHGPPLASGSCNPPTQTSPSITVGSPDANGAPTNSVSSMRYKALVGAPGTPDDSDVAIHASLTDVRCRNGAAGVPPCGGANGAAGPDYSGELEARVLVRMTDKFNDPAPGGGSDAATAMDTELAAPFSCSDTTSTSIGASCTLSTSANALVAGLVRDTKRAIWQFDRVQVFDGGPDGDVNTGGSLFATQGVFVP